MSDEAVQILRNLQPGNDYFIGIDSDGCVFDTMELKQKECFIPTTIRVFGLQAVSKCLRETAEFVNLYSRWRGTNRFPALLRTMDFLRERPEVQSRGVEVPRLEALRRWIDEETRLGDPALRARIQATGDGELRRVLDWTQEVNRAIREMVRGAGPFPMSRESIEKAGAHADLIVVSQTPGEALEREWAEHGMERLVRAICGQEYGTKAEHIRYAAEGKYGPGRVLMIGDAPGDRQAAEANGALFFPINPGAEDASWKEFHDMGLGRFLDGTFAGEYQKKLIRDFDALLPESPTW